MTCLAFARFAGIVAILFLLPFEGLGQNAPPATRARPSQPSEPHERMAVFEGTWTMQPNPYFKGQPAGTPLGAGEETCAWLPGGRRHMICRSWRERDGARTEAMYILSYRTQEDIYIAHHAFPDGANLTYHGRVEGERWIMDMVSAPNLRPNQRFRTIITKVPDGIRYVEELSIDGGPWEITEDYRLRRVK